MMQPENEGVASSPLASPAAGGDDIFMDDEEAPAPDSKGKMAGGDEITFEKLQIQFLAMTEYLRQELSTMDAEKAKRLGFQAKEKAVMMALALKALMIQYVNELKQMDKDKARELGVKYQGKAKELGLKYRTKTVEVAGIARRKAVLVAGELKTIDKQKSIEMMRKGKVVYKEMKPATKIKYGLIFGILFIMMFSSPSGGYKEVKHNHLCYFHDAKFEPKQKVAMCEKMLTGATKGKTNWIFIGNEPMYALFHHFHKISSGRATDVDTHPIQQVRADRGKKRKVMFYYKYDQPDKDEWDKKYLNQENPTEIASALGLGTAEADNCKMRKYDGIKKDFQMEFLCVEASRDVSQLSTTTSTTQETVARWLSENYPDKTKTACVVQQGSHEMKKAPWKTTQQYLQHTKEFHDKLEQHCGVLIRIGQFRDHGDLKNKIDDWNEGTRDLVLKSSQNGYFIDLSHVSNPGVETYLDPMFGMFTRLQHLFV